MFYRTDNVNERNPCVTSARVGIVCYFLQLVHHTAFNSTRSSERTPHYIALCAIQVQVESRCIQTLIQPKIYASKPRSIGSIRSKAGCIDALR